MSYKLYTDKEEIFECGVSVKNASLKNATARLIVESDNATLMFNGVIKNDKCSIPIKKLKGLLDESAKGKIHLEIIVEDTYFKPWESDFIVEKHTSVNVTVTEQVSPPTKKGIEVQCKGPVGIQKIAPPAAKLAKKTIPVAIKPTPTSSTPIKELVSICKLFEITRANYKADKKIMFKNLIKEYFKANDEFKPKLGSILNEVIINLK